MNMLDEIGRLYNGDIYGIHLANNMISDDFGLAETFGEQL